MTQPQLEALQQAFGQLQYSGAGLEQVASFLQDPSACLRSTAAFLLSRVRQYPAVQELLERAATQSPDTVVQFFAAADQV